MSNNNTEKKNLIPTEEKINTTKSDNKSCFSKWCSFLTVDYYKSYFDFSDAELIERLKLCVLMQKTKFEDLVVKKPDLYNPVWISFCLVLALAILSNINAFLHYKGDNFDFNYFYLTEALSMVFGFLVFIPSCFFLFLMCFGIEFTKDKLFTCFSLYAYSNMFLLFAVLLCFIPNGMLNFICLAAGCAFSVLFLIMVFSEFLENFKGKMHYISLLVIVAGQALVCLAFKLKFFPNVDFNVYDYKLYRSY